VQTDDVLLNVIHIFSWYLTDDEYLISY